MLLKQLVVKWGIINNVVSCLVQWNVIVGERTEPTALKRFHLCYPKVKNHSRSLKPEYISIAFLNENHHDEFIGRISAFYHEFLQICDKTSHFSPGWVKGKCQIFPPWMNRFWLYAENVFPWQKAPNSVPILQLPWQHLYTDFSSKINQQKHS